MHTTLSTLPRLAVAALLGAAAAACSDTPPTGGYEADSIAPSVSVSQDGQSAVVRATDNISLKRVTIAMDGLGAADTTFYAATASFEKTIDIPVGVSATLDIVARDGAGNTTTRSVRVGGGSGPALSILSPGVGAEAAPGRPIIVEVKATDEDGVRRTGFVITSGGKAVATDNTQLPSGVRDTTVTRTVTVPTDAAEGSTLLITAFAVDMVGDSTGGVTATVAVKSATTQSPPLVHQTIPARVEALDAVLIDATSASGITSLGFSLTCRRDGSTIQRDTTMPPDWIARPIKLVLNLPASCVGQTIYITSHATSGAGKTGYSVPATVMTAQGDPALAWRDSSVAVYGRTTPLRTGARGTLGVDVAVDETYQRVFVSNFYNDRIDVWENGAFSKEVPVGSQPWGIFIANNNLYIANSGGTNISVVPVSGPTSSLAEATRYRTQNLLAWEVKESRDPTTGAVRFTRSSAYDFSDRPQFLAIGQSGKLYFSTKPTPAAPDGTIRVFDPSKPVPEPTQIGDYMAEKLGSIVVLNADGVQVIRSQSNGVSDTLIVCDHPYGTSGASQCVKGVSALGVLTALQGALAPAGTDVRMYFDADINTLALTDTTFVAAGGDRRWIGFGEGNTPGAGRVMMMDDATDYFSPGTQVHDLIGNASEPVSGLAINADSRLTAARGQEAFFFSVDQPYHLRLEGSVHTYPRGAGIAFHPQNSGIGTSTPPDVRLAFVASSNGTIEVADSYHWGNRGTLPVRARLYGPLRAVLPFGTEPTDLANPVVLKLFGLSAEGLVAIDVRRCDLLTETGSSPAGCP
ncbi:MAG TPA: hypothetical protein VFS05_03640 [Gemmatimonadaceae bacterium]|nr:hypothetical protein [Gemmatimonadaceae bacterium]